MIDLNRKYLNILTTISNIKSPYTEPDQVQELQKYCLKYLTEHLKEFNVYTDSSKNIIALPYFLDSTKPLLYLSAHIDTVPGDPAEWTFPFHPYKVYRDKTQIVARGVNDCKAGVALQLYIAKLIFQNDIKSCNLAFLLTFKEEGSGTKTATKLGEAFGMALPVHSNTTVLVLENTLTVAPTTSLGVYTSERSSYAIEIEGTLDFFQKCLHELKLWYPVAIKSNDSITTSTSVVTQEARHVCSTARDENKLLSIILESDRNAVINAGDLNNFATIPSRIEIGRCNEEVMHKLVLTLRDTINYESVVSSLESFQYTEKKPFALSKGLSGQSNYRENIIYKALFEDTSISAQNEINPGASDGSTISAVLSENLKDKILFIVAGPGCRSNKMSVPKRMTHGANETFYIQPGIIAVNGITKAIIKAGFLHSYYGG